MFKMSPQLLRILGNTHMRDSTGNRHRKDIGQTQPKREWTQEIEIHSYMDREERLDRHNPKREDHPTVMHQLDLDTTTDMETHWQDIDTERHTGKTLSWERGEERRKEDLENFTTHRHKPDVTKLTLTAPTFALTAIKYSV